MDALKQLMETEKMTDPKRIQALIGLIAQAREQAEKLDVIITAIDQHLEALESDDECPREGESDEAYRTRMEADHE